MRESQFETGSKEGAAQYWRSAMASMRQVRSLAGAGILAAAGMALKSLTIDITQLLRITFAFLPTALSGYLYGPVVAGFAGAVLDVLGYLIHPTGAYFPGFTLGAFLNGMLYGLWLWKRPVSLWRTGVACATSTVMMSFLLNPLWLTIMYGEAWLPMVLVRIPKNAIQLPVNIALLFLLLKLVEKQKHRLVRG